MREALLFAFCFLLLTWRDYVVVTSECYNYYCSNANNLRPPSLPALTSTLSNKEMLRSLLDYNVLTEVVRWITPHSGKLGNVTIRRDLLRAVGNMKGESGINSSDLKKSQIGRLVMQLYSCSAETNDMKAIHKGLIDAWSRPIFKKSGNYRDLAEVEVARREKGWEPKNMRKRPRAANDSSRSRFFVSAASFAFWRQRKRKRLEGRRQNIVDTHGQSSEGEGQHEGQG